MKCLALRTSSESLAKRPATRFPGAAPSVAWLAVCLAVMTPAAAVLMSSAGCNKPRPAGGDLERGSSTRVGGPRPGDPDCYDTRAALPCPADSSDPSGRGLPTPGGVCRLAPCAACGSATAPAFRARDGVAHPGFCVCVVRSDDSGISVYSCLVPDPARPGSPAK